MTEHDSTPPRDLEAYRAALRRAAAQWRRGSVQIAAGKRKPFRVGVTSITTSKLRTLGEGNSWEEAFADAASRDNSGKANGNR